jgi:hypothetical protein
MLKLKRRWHQSDTIACIISSSEPGEMGIPPEKKGNFGRKIICKKCFIGDID